MENSIDITKLNSYYAGDVLEGGEVIVRVSSDEDHMVMLTISITDNWFRVRTDVDLDPIETGLTFRFMNDVFETEVKNTLFETSHHIA